MPGWVVICFDHYHVGPDNLDVFGVFGDAAAAQAWLDGAHLAECDLDDHRVEPLASAS